MNRFFASFKPAALLLLLFTLAFGIIYPLLVFGLGQLFFPAQANGTLFYYENDAVLGSEWIAQGFSQSQYFHPRPSNAGNGYDATNSSGSNLGPTSQKLADALQAAAHAYRSANHLSSDTPIPADAVTGSGSGLDPHISVMNALLQAPRVASERGLTEQAVKDFIAKYTEGPTWGLFGEERINVLRLNLALDKLQDPP